MKHTQAMADIGRTSSVSVQSLFPDVIDHVTVSSSTWLGAATTSQRQSWLFSYVPSLSRSTGLMTPVVALSMRPPQPDSSPAEEMITV